MQESICSYEDFKSLDVDQINKHLVGAVQYCLGEIAKLKEELARKS